MRTTLKRGIGRAGGLNGNGHSAVPPLFGPITRYRQPEPSKRSFMALLVRGVGWFVVALAVLVGGVAGGLYLYDHQSLAAVKAHTKAVVNAEKRLYVPTPNGPAVALVAGYDHRAGTGTNAYAGSNSDTLMLLRADPTNHTLSLLSFPRDLSVPIYCKGGTSSTQDRINAAWADCGTNGGPYAAVDTMEHLTGLHINYLITLDFHAFKEIVNRLHGVYMNVDRRYYNPLHTGWSAINLEPGYQKLDGGQALSYVRFRHLDSDIYRTGRQQLFMAALKARLRTSISLSNIFTIPKLIGALKGNLEVAKAGGGAVTNSELESYLGLMYHLPPGHLFRDQIPAADFQNIVTPAGADVLRAPQSAIDRAVHNFLHPVVRQPRELGIPGTKTVHHVKKKPTLPKSKISVLVLNAGRVPGRAANTTYLLTQHGYATETLPSNVPANAPAVRRETTIYYDPVQPYAKQAAQELRPLFGSHSRIEQISGAIGSLAGEAGNPLTVVAVGTSFSGKLKIPRPVKPVRQVPPQVSPGISITAPRLRGLTRRVHFPVMAPHQIAQYSQFSSDVPVRVFKPVRNRHEVVLTFVLPNGIQYWQIEETDWTSAPILQNPTGQFVYRHRKFLLYTTGGAIQMVVLRTPKATYWVVNSILNQLSNSTMIAIAESLQPLGR